MAKDENGKLWFAGLPTDPTIRRIREEWPDESLEEGQLIPYEEVEEVTGFSKNTSHFRSATHRWRKKVEQNIGYVVGVRPNVGFVILNDKEALDVGESKFRQSIRSAKRSWVIHSRVNPKNLNENERQRYELTRSRAAAVVSTGQIKSKAKLPTIEDTMNQKEKE